MTENQKMVLPTPSIPEKKPECGKARHQNQNVDPHQATVWGDTTLQFKRHTKNLIMIFICSVFPQWALLTIGSPPNLGLLKCLFGTPGWCRPCLRIQPEPQAVQTELLSLQRRCRNTESRALEPDTQQMAASPILTNNELKKPFLRHFQKKFRSFHLRTVALSEGC